MSKKNTFRPVSTVVAMVLLATGGTAGASMGNLGTTFGVLPSDLATAGALSLFNTQASAVYYNPAYLTQDPRGELTLGMMHAQPQLTVNSKWNDGTVTRSGTNVLENDPSQQLLLGMKTDLSSMTKYKAPTYLGVMLGVERYGQEMMAFGAETSQAGQYLEFGRKPMFLVIGGGSTLWRGISGGFSTRVTLHSAATMNAQSTMAGQTSYEMMDVSAKPKIRPILGLNVDWGKTLCPDQDCWIKGFETALSYRAFSNSKTTVSSNITIPGTVPSPGVALAITTLDAYQPDIYSLGLLYGKDKDYRVGLTLEWQRWSALEDELEKDTIKDQAVAPVVGRLRFRDILVPRLGGEFRLNERVRLSGGLAFSPTPLKSNTSLDINYLDADKIIAGAGLTFEFPKPPVFAYPLRLDLGYQYQQMGKKTFDLYTSQNPAPGQTERHYETVTTGGSVNVFSASVMLKF